MGKSTIINYRVINHVYHSILQTWYNYFYLFKIWRSEVVCFGYCDQFSFKTESVQYIFNNQVSQLETSTHEDIQDWIRSCSLTDILGLVLFWLCVFRRRSSKLCWDTQLTWSNLFVPEDWQALVVMEQSHVVVLRLAMPPRMQASIFRRSWEVKNFLTLSGTECIERTLVGDMRFLHTRRPRSCTMWLQQWRSCLA